MSPNRLLEEKPDSPHVELSAVHGNGNGNGHTHVLSAEGGFTLFDVVRCTVRHKWKVFCFCFLTISLAAAAALYWPKTYRSEAKLFVRVGRQSIGEDPTANLNRGTVALQVTREEELNTVVDLLRSRSMIEKVVDQVGPGVILNSSQEAGPSSSGPSASHLAWIAEITNRLQEWKKEFVKDVPLSPREQAIHALQNQLDVQNVRKTDVINVTHEGPSPEVSQRLVASLVGCCIDQHVQMNRSPGAQAFLTSEASAMKSELARTEEALRALKNKSGLAAPAEQRQALVNQIARLEEDVATTATAAAAAEAENRELSNELAGLSGVEELGKSTGNPNFAADGMRQQLYALQLKEKDLASRVTEQHFELKSIRAQIKAATPILEAMEPTRTQTSIGRNHIHDELRLAYLRQAAVLASQRARSATLRNLLSAATRRLQTLGDNEIRITQLQRDAQILDAGYRRYADTREQARLAESLDREKFSNMTIAQPASLSLRPVRPQRSLILLTGCFFALVGAPCLALAAEHFRRARKGPEEIAKPLRRPIPVSISS